MKAGSRRRHVLLAVGACAVLAALWLARDALGIELDPNSIRVLVEDLGWWGPLAYVMLVTFRISLGIPSQLALIAGGLVFGTALGTAYGAVGLTLSALLLFLIARWAGREAVEARLGERFSPVLDVASHRWGAGFIAVGTAYPFGPISAYHGLAGVTRMSLGTFALAASAGSLGRSIVYTYFGSSLMQGDTTSLLVAAVLLGLAFVAPWLHPASRAWVRGWVRPEARPAEAPATPVPGAPGSDARG